MAATSHRPQYGLWRGMDDEELTNALPKVGPFPAAGLVRRARRLADLSQRQMARLAKVAASTVGKVESGTMRPSLELFERLIATAGLYLIVVDQDGRVVMPMIDRTDTRDGAERRYPSHLDTILDPEEGEWWADVYGLARPPETYYRDRRRRDHLRGLSQWEVRGATSSGEPVPADPDYAAWRQWRARSAPADPGTLPCLDPDDTDPDEIDPEE
jgi:transcriptional regulator with XRE-family HTH domain